MSHTVAGNQAWNNVASNSVEVQRDAGLLTAVAIRSPGLSGTSTGNTAFDDNSLQQP